MMDQWVFRLSFTLFCFHLVEKKRTTMTYCNDTEIALCHQDTLTANKYA